MRGIKYWKNPLNRFSVVRIHYTADPAKDPETKAGQAWLDEVRPGYSEEGWEREYEINFTIMAGRPVYADFKMDQVVSELKWNKAWVLYRGWDLGFNRPAVHFSCMDNKDRWLWLYPEQLGFEISFLDFVDYILDVTKANFPDAMIRDFFPHDARHVDPLAKDTNLNTHLKQAAFKGLMPEISPITNVFDGINLIREKMRLRRDSEFGILIDSRNKVEIESLAGGYHRNPRPEKGDDIVKDGYFDNLMDAGRSTAVSVLVPGVERNTYKSKFIDPSTQLKYHPITGGIIS